MTVHNSLQRYNDLSRAYKNALGLDEGGLERAGETLTPTFPLFELPEYGVQRGELLGSFTADVAAVAGQYAGIAVGVEATARELIVLEPTTRAMLASGGVDTYAVRGMDIADMKTKLATPGVVYSHDSRRWDGAGGGLNAPIPIVARTGTNAVPSGDTLGLLYCNSATPFAESIASLGPIIIAPGYAVALWGSTANTFFRANLRLRVRVLQPGEDSA